MKGLAILLIRFYQAVHGAFFFGTCRFHPTCSHYAVEAFQTRGFFTGLALTAYRLMRCQPFCKGGWDPVPPRPTGLAPWALSLEGRHPVPPRRIAAPLLSRRTRNLRRRT